MISHLFRPIYSVVMVFTLIGLSLNAHSFQTELNEDKSAESAVAGVGIVALAENSSQIPDETFDTLLEYCDLAREFWVAGNSEQAMEILDNAYELLLKVDIEKNPELIQQKEDFRFTISKRILEIYASRSTKVKGIHREIPLIINDYVEREIKSFQGSERNLFLDGYKRSGKYRGEMVKALNEAGLPEELSWLPLIESWFKVRAFSPARALGLWQFIPSTGYRFGLKRDMWIDDRMDPKKSTHAAIAYLKELHQLFGDWTTVLAAYNCGEGRVLRVMREQKINYLDNFWDLYQMLPRETARYVPRFLATLFIVKEPEKYGFTFDELDSPLVYETITIEKQVRIEAVADALGIPHDDLVILNPELKIGITPPVKYNLNVPDINKDILLAKLDSIPAWATPKNDYSSSDYVLHKVKKGETLSRLAVKYSTSVVAIMKKNKLNTSSILPIGKKLKIPL